MLSFLWYCPFILYILYVVKGMGYCEDEDRHVNDLWFWECTFKQIVYYTTSPYPQSYVITSNDKSKVSVNIELIFISDCLFNQKPYCQYTENKNSVLAQHILLWKILCLYKYI